MLPVHDGTKDKVRGMDCDPMNSLWLTGFENGDDDQTTLLMVLLRGSSHALSRSANGIV
jgi:hypothetical protein